ncbi:MAG: hypothetical protein H6831_09220 [Planctomycetes bacterium]|nr:hypothetical protein [Planctomycetota bacterium]MCB9904573.1 hypothetical protein [Planctomycetota bacterium]
MKNLLLGFAVCTVAFACKSNDKAEVTSPEGASAPDVSCCDSAKSDCGSSCDSAAKADCSTKSECSGAKVCPVTGKVIEN